MMDVTGFGSDRLIQSLAISDKTVFGKLFGWISAFGRIRQDFGKGT